MSASTLAAVLCGLVITGSLNGAEIGEITKLNRLIESHQVNEALEMAQRVTNLDAWSKDGETPLTRAAQSYSNNTSYDVIHSLLALGASPHRRNREGATPLHYAARMGTLSVVHLLVDDKRTA